ncbi:Mpo1-like protein [Cryptosporangium aurantiacum]|uniref:PEP-CTERM protein-sorting domain-containing protein n=1 Tax=Cryptosporangium aurantiacum TaxID=134849 RepID=A0A1M7N6S9_9ACTN|nr:Mpo1-like protein [Cryptosporangium aurantiacum]SHM99280.1 PEP-CTERM protein-sorting domain-containing protein [Cryptosporangium aurantiacum]
MAPRFDTFEQFWPYYVARHADAITRWGHLGGFGAGLLAAGIALRRRRSLVSIALLPAIRYAAAAATHRLVEHNTVFTPPRELSLDQQLWFVRADARMWTMMLSGRDAELQLLADRWNAEHARRSSGSPVDVRV